MIAEAHAIREVLVDSQMANNLQARQNHVQTEETVRILKIDIKLVFK